MGAALGPLASSHTLPRGPCCLVLGAGWPLCPSLQPPLAGAGLLFPADCTLWLAGAWGQGKVSPECQAKPGEMNAAALDKGKFLDSKSLSTPLFLVTGEAVARFRGTGRSPVETQSK